MSWQYGLCRLRLLGTAAWMTLWAVVIWVVATPLTGLGAPPHLVSTHDLILDAR